MRDNSTDYLDRRSVIKAGGAAGVTGLTGFAGCLGSTSGGGNSGTSAAPADVEPADEINFISESTPPSVAVKQIIDEFQQETGITVNMTLVPFNNYSEKIASDLNSRSGNYHAFYVDPYVVGAKYYPRIQPLDSFINSDAHAELPGGVDDFIDSHVDACGRYGDGSLRALPYDCPTMMWVYRDDIIQNYKSQAESDLGFPFEPGPERTWQEYYEMAEWMNENVSEVPYGTGQQAKQHDSLQCDFHNVFWAHGAEDFEGYNGKPGDSVPDQVEPTFASDTGIEAATFYNDLIDIAHPGSTTWTWSGVGEAFSQGKIAMTAEWHEFNASFANPDQSQVADSIGWTLLPQADERNVNIYGGSGVGINADATDAEKVAAWEFISWATSPDIQFRVLERTGGTPTRNSVYEREEVQQAKEKPTEESEYPNVVPPVEDAWQAENIGLRPHIPQWPELNQILYTELSRMVNDEISPEEAMQAVDDGWGNTLQ